MAGIGRSTGTSTCGPTRSAENLNRNHRVIVGGQMPPRAQTSRHIGGLTPILSAEGCSCRGRFHHKPGQGNPESKRKR